LGTHAREARQYLRATAKARFEGTLTKPGCYGHMGGSRRELKVTKVESFHVTDTLPRRTLPPEK
jgi:hypothetical protein